MNVQDTIALAEYVQRRINEQRLSTYIVAQRSGNAISHAWVSNICNNKIKEIKPSKLEALAKGLGVSVFVLHDILTPKARVNADSWERWAWLETALEMLPDSTRRDVEADIQIVARALIQRRSAA